MSSHNKQHGGSRPGAGRPPFNAAEGARQKTNLTLLPSHKRRLQELKNNGVDQRAVIDCALEYALKIFEGEK